MKPDFQASVVFHPLDTKLQQQGGDVEMQDKGLENASNMARSHKQSGWGTHRQQATDLTNTDQKFW